LSQAFSVLNTIFIPTPSY